MKAAPRSSPAGSLSRALSCRHPSLSPSTRRMRRDAIPTDVRTRVDVVWRRERERRARTHTRLAGRRNAPASRRRILLRHGDAPTNATALSPPASCTQLLERSTTYSPQTNIRVGTGVEFGCGGENDRTMRFAFRLRDCGGTLEIWPFSSRVGLPTTGAGVVEVLGRTPKSSFFKFIILGFVSVFFYRTQISFLKY